MNPASRVVLILASILCFLNAADIRITGANKTEYWVFVDDRLDSLDLNYKEHFTEKLKLTTTYEDLLLKGVFFVWDPSIAVPGSLQYFDFTAQYTKAPVSVLYGTFYTTFGRGLCLNQFLDEDFNLDNSLYGLKVDFNIYDTKLTLISGKPRNIFFEELAYKIKNDVDTAQIRGANIEKKIVILKQGVNIFTTVGGRYVRINRVTDLTPRAFTELFGGNIGLTVGPWESYFEYGRHLGTRPVTGGRLDGYGMLATTGLALPGFGISFQYMDYDELGFGGSVYRFDDMRYAGPVFRYNETPTPIQSGIAVNRGTDEIGHGVTMILSPIDLFSLELSHNKISTHDASLSKLEEIVKLDDSMEGVLEQLGKLIVHPNYDMEITAGFERVVKNEIELPVHEKTEIKPYVEFQYDLGTFFIDLGYDHTMVSSDTSDYYDQAVSFSLGKPELFVLSLRYERRNRVPDWLIHKLGEDTSWPMVELSLDLTTKHNLRIRVGAEKGGLVCTGGVCRFEEPFRGVKLVLTSRF
jgi:hypothetical protein